MINKTLTLVFILCVSMALPSSGLSRDCRSLLKQSDVNDFFHDPLLACPFEDTGDPPEGGCTNDLERAPREEPRYLPEANRLPEYEFEEMVLGDFASTCEDIFASPAFLKIVESITPAEEHSIRSRWTRLEGQAISVVQGKMASVFQTVGGWSYCHRYNRSIDETVHAQLFPMSREIVLFRTSCDTTMVYNESISQLNIGHRFALVSAHELGHLIDQAAGGDLRRDEAEDYATYIGTFFAECHGKVVTKIIRDAGEASETPGQVKARRRLLKRYACFQEAVLDIRASVSNSMKNPKAKPNKKANLFLCATPNQ